jgi:threonine dehydratase
MGMIPSPVQPMPVNFDDIRAAADRLAGVVRRTPVMTCRAIDAMAGAQLLFKCEGFQRTGSFKYRGAANAVRLLEAQAAQHGVVTVSSGNHGAALALAGAERGIAVTVVMPATASRPKQAAIEAFGGTIMRVDGSRQDCDQVVQQVIDRTGGLFIPPYNHAAIIAGQGTCALELLDEAGPLEAIVAPLGGGGLLSGTAVAAHGHSATLSVCGAEPAEADDAYRSLQAGQIVPSLNPRTIADGLRSSLGPLTFQIIRSRVEAIITVSERQIIDAMRLVWERMKIIIEPSSATAVAAVLAEQRRFADRRVGVILSGANLDLDRLPWQ